MRTRRTKNGVTVHAISGTHVVMLGMNVTSAARKKLLGFAIRREDTTEHEVYWLKGLKTFKETVPIQVPGQQYSLAEHPVQSFRWADYTAKEKHEYIYEVFPVYGEPKYLELGTPVTVPIATEREGLASNTHDVYFNRGVSASQAYARKFKNITPDELPAAQRDQAYLWLSRGLLEAALAFIGKAKDARFGLRAAVYEFNYEPILQAFKQAHQAGADVEIVYDARRKHPKDSTEAALKKAGIKSLATARTTNTSYIAHNKFIVLLKDGAPIEVWTGSTNFTRGGIFGQSNVGHIVRDGAVARAYLEYWTQLKADASAKDLRDWMAPNNPDIDGPPPKNSIRVLFSPRKGLDVLEWYADRLNDASTSAHMTAAFGVHPLFEAVLGKQKAHLRYVLQERRDPQQAAWTVDRDVQAAAGAKIGGDMLYAWTKETLTGFNFHVQYIHDKFMLIDPFSNDPLVITGSANFSEASTTNNDENMLVIRGDTRVADIYLGEFMRLFSHYYFRDLIRKQQGEEVEHPRALYLTPNASWTTPYFKKFSVKAKQRVLFSGSSS